MSNKIEIIKVKPSECALAIAATFAGRRVPFIWGPPGVAKSAIAQKYATDRGKAFADIRLSQMEPTDLRGIPFPTVENGVHGVKWSPPLVLPRDLKINQVVKIEYAETVEFTFENSNPVGSNGIHYVKDPHVEVSYLQTEFNASSLRRRAVVFGKTPTSAVVGIVELDDNGDLIPALDEHGAPIPLTINGEPVIAEGDVQYQPRLYPGAVRVHVTGEAEVVVGLEEFNSAPQSVQAASYQLILDRRLGEYVVPEKVDLMALGNRDTDKGITFKMPTPAANRFEHFEMQSDFDEWLEWAVNNDIHWTIVGFLSKFKEFLFQFEPSTASRGFATPRSWHMLSDIISASDNNFLTGNVFTAICCGAVGDAIGLQYIEFRKIADSLPDSDDVLSGRLTHISEQSAKSLVSVNGAGGIADSVTKVKLQISFAMISSLTYELYERLKKIKEKHGRDGYAKTDDFVEWMAQADNFIGFVLNNFEPEPCIMAGRIAVRVRGLPFVTKKMKNFEVYASSFKEFLVN